MIGIDWMADEPVPTTPTRWPVKSTPSCGQWPVWYHLPEKLARPGTSGTCAADRHPVAGVRLHLPAVRPFVEGRGRDARAELDVAPQVEAVGDVFEVAEDLRLRGV